LELPKFGCTEEDLLAEALEHMSSIPGSNGACFHQFDEFENAIDLVVWSRAVPAYFTTTTGSHQPLNPSASGPMIWADAVRLRAPVVHNDCLKLPQQGSRACPRATSGCSGT
jgi:hypothetical protein